MYPSLRSHAYHWPLTDLNRQALFAISSEEHVHTYSKEILVVRVEIFEKQRRDTVLRPFLTWNFLIQFHCPWSVLKRIFCHYCCYILAYLALFLPSTISFQIKLFLGWKLNFPLWTIIMLYHFLIYSLMYPSYACLLFVQLESFPGVDWPCPAFH